MKKYKCIYDYYIEAKTIDSTIGRILNPACDNLDAESRVSALEDLVIELIKCLDQKTIDKFMKNKGYIPEEK